jgi:hypothetical protein
MYDLWYVTCTFVGGDWAMAQSKVCYVQLVDKFESRYAMGWDSLVLARYGQPVFAVAVDGIDPNVVNGLAIVGALTIVGFICYKLRHLLEENLPAIAKAFLALVDFYFDLLSRAAIRNAEFEKLQERLKSQRARRRGEKREPDDKQDRKAA